MKPTAPIRETQLRNCSICGDKLEDQTTAREICYGCWCDRQIPNLKAYQKREQYARFTTTETNPIRNATMTPKTGVPYLDQKKTIVWDVFCKPQEILELRKREQKQGLDTGEYWHPKVYS